VYVIRHNQSEESEEEGSEGERGEARGWVG
jgi:hypothetical protein